MMALYQKLILLIFCFLSVPTDMYFPIMHCAVQFVNCCTLIQYVHYSQEKGTLETAEIEN